MERFNIFLDSNIFIGAKYNFSGGSLSNLKKLCENGTAALFSNDIILREVENHINNDIGLMARQARNSIKNHSELINAMTLPVYKTIESTLQNSVENLRSQFEIFMEGAIILSNKDLSMVALFNDYFEKRAPFENNEKKKFEFPDAVTIMSIKRYLKERNGVTLHVVTNDDGWHAALSGIDSIFLYKSLTDLLKKIAKDEESLYTLVTAYMNQCTEGLKPSAEDWFVCQDWSAAVDTIDICIDCEEVEDMYITSIDLVSDGVEYIDRDGDFASGIFSGVATFYLGFQYIDHSNEIYDREDGIYYNTIYGKGAAEIEVSFSSSVTILISDDGQMELNSPELDDINLDAFKVIDYRLTPYRDDDDPYFTTCPDCGKVIGIHNDGGNGFCVDCASQH